MTQESGRRMVKESFQYPGHLANPQLPALCSPHLYHTMFSLFEHSLVAGHILGCYQKKTKQLTSSLRIFLLPETILLTIKAAGSISNKKLCLFENSIAAKQAHKSCQNNCHSRSHYIQCCEEESKHCRNNTKN